jgi:nitroreductase
MDIEKVFNERRSAHTFEPAENLDESMIRKIYDLAKLAPSSFNLQPWKIVLVSQEGNKQRLRKCAMDQPKVTEASHVAIVLGDCKAYEDMDGILDDFVAWGYFPEPVKPIMKSAGYNLYHGDNERAFASRNAGLFAMAFMMAAHALGVHTHPMDGMDTAAVRKEFNIPERYEIVMLIGMGERPEDAEIKPRLPRKGFDDVVIKESF